MSGKLQNLRRRLLELEELHATGFVDMAQYEESRALLEHWIVAAVIEEGAEPGDTVPAAAPQDDPAPSAAPSAPPYAAMLDEPQAEPPADDFIMPITLDPAHAAAAGPSAAASSAGRRRWPIWLAAGVLLPAGGLALYRGIGVPSTTGVSSPVAAVEAQASAAHVVEASAPPPAGLPDPAAAVSSRSVPNDVVTPGVPGTLAGTVALSPAMAQRVHARDTVFIYARAVDGPPMPLAVIRKQVKDLPLSFVLDDAMAIWPEARVSAYPRVVVTARVSRSGAGKAQVGDIEGQSAVVAAGTAGLRIEIGSVVTAPGAGDALPPR